MNNGISRVWTDVRSVHGRFRAWFVVFSRCKVIINWITICYRLFCAKDTWNNPSHILFFLLSNFCRLIIFLLNYSICSLNVTNVSREQIFTWSRVKFCQHFGVVGTPATDSAGSIRVYAHNRETRSSAPTAALLKQRGQRQRIQYYASVFICILWPNSVFFARTYVCFFCVTFFFSTLQHVQHIFSFSNLETVRFPESRSENVVSWRVARRSRGKWRRRWADGRSGAGFYTGFDSKTHGRRSEILSFLSCFF